MRKRTTRRTRRPVPEAPWAASIPSPFDLDRIRELETENALLRARVADLPLPKEILIGAMVRPGEEARIVRGWTELEAGDHVVVFGRPNTLAVVKPIFVS